MQPVGAFFLGFGFFQFFDVGTPAAIHKSV